MREKVEKRDIREEFHSSKMGTFLKQQNKKQTRKKQVLMEYLVSRMFIFE